MRQHRGLGGSGEGPGGHAGGRAPGRTTLVEQVMRKAAGRNAAGAQEDPGSTVEAAEAGIQGSGHALPHLSAIQSSFGRHDVGHIQAHTDGAASEASRKIGAQAYAAGAHVAFDGAPDLHTAAHEAAHVVQQRAGVSLKGGVGQAGDAYERHADLVADAVVAGRSAEALLDQAPGGHGGGGSAIQKQEAPGATPEAPAEGGEASAEGGEAPAEQPAEKSKGKQLREAILAAAQKRYDDKTEIVSDEKLQEIRTGKGWRQVGLTDQGEPMMQLVDVGKAMPNYTTCIEFSGQVFRDGVLAVSKDAAEAKRLSLGLQDVMTKFNKEVHLRIEVEGLNKRIAGLDSKEAMKKRSEREQLAGEVAELKEQEDLDAQEKARLAQKQMVLKQLDAYLGQIDKQKANLKQKLAGKTEKLATVKEQNPAWIRPQPGLEGGRPQEGEYILLSQPQGGPAKVGPAGVSLATGAFRHIAVLTRIEKDVGGDPDLELWHTMDGGGKTAEPQTNYVRKSDLMVFRQPPTNAGARPVFALAGWVDANVLAGEDADTPN